MTTRSREKIITEVKAVVKTFIRGIESCDLNLLLPILDNSPDFIASANGMTLPYNEFTGFAGQYFGKLKNQENFKPIK